MLACALFQNGRVDYSFWFRSFLLQVLCFMDKTKLMTNKAKKRDKPGGELVAFFVVERRELQQHPWMQIQDQNHLSQKHPWSSSLQNRWTGKMFCFFNWRLFFIVSILRTQFELLNAGFLPPKRALTTKTILTTIICFESR